MWTCETEPQHRSYSSTADRTNTEQKDKTATQHHGRLLESTPTPHLPGSSPWRHCARRGAPAPHTMVTPIPQCHAGATPTIVISMPWTRSRSIDNYHEGGPPGPRLGSQCNFPPPAQSPPPQLPADGSKRPRNNVESSSRCRRLHMGFASRRLSTTMRGGGGRGLQPESWRHRPCHARGGATRWARGCLISEVLGEDGRKSFT